MIQITRQGLESPTNRTTRLNNNLTHIRKAFDMTIKLGQPILLFRPITNLPYFLVIVDVYWEELRNALREYVKGFIPENDVQRCIKFLIKSFLLSKEQEWDELIEYMGAYQKSRSNQKNRSKPKANLCLQEEDISIYKFDEIFQEFLERVVDINANSRRREEVLNAAECRFGRLHNKLKSLIDKPIGQTCDYKDALYYFWALFKYYQTIAAYNLHRLKHDNHMPETLSPLRRAIGLAGNCLQLNTDAKKLLEPKSVKLIKISPPTTKSPTTKSPNAWRKLGNYPTLRWNLVH